jgi:radical SAM superfamily enzyme YgiQ (UPF0313 family)
MNLWSRPLGLLKVAEYMSQFELQIRLIDCMDVFEKRQYGMGKYLTEIVEKPEVVKRIPRFFKRYGISLSEFRERLESFMPYDFVFLTSIMSYWYPGVLKAIEIVRNVSPHVPIFLGGIYATLFHEHASRYSGADSVCRGHIGNNIISILDNFGIHLKSKSPLRVVDLPPLPEADKGSRSTTRSGGFFKERQTQTPYYKLNFYKSYPFAPILTSLGCPFRCSYCASLLLSDSFIQREPYDVMREILELYENGTGDFAFYDDALLVNADFHVKPLLERVIQSNLRVRFHCPNGIHARFIDDELAYLMKESGFTTIRLSLETVNDDRNAVMGGKVTAETLRAAVKMLKSQGFTKREIGVYLMYGLPGQDLNEVRDGVRFLKDLDVKINLTEFSPIPGTQCWNELKEKNIINEGLDPLLTNNSVFSYLFSGYNPSELEELKLDVKNYNRRMTDA